jgi:hydroxyethylthiazole kinase-like uncharacterized protein yjeF
VRDAYTADQIRAAEKPLLDSLPDGALMQRAATALTRRCAQVLGGTYGRRVVLLVGAGNNGGDALFAGAQLRRRGADVVAVLADDRSHDAGRSALVGAGGRCVAAGDDTPALVAGADLVVDGLVGIGARGALRPPFDRLADACAQGCAPVVAVDVPSGVDASTGRVDGAAVRADITVTFGAAKTGLMVDPGAAYAGLVDVVDIGLTLPDPDLTLLDAADVAALLPTPDRETDKYRRGVVGIVAGSDVYTGAAVLAVGGALAAGAGMVRYAGVAHPAELVRQHWPEAVVTVVADGDGDAVVAAGRVQAWVVGAGLGTGEAAARIVARVLQSDVPVVADADALTVLADHHDWLHTRTATTVLTPHAGEFARLMSVDRHAVEADRVTHTRAAAQALGATVLLKGSTTVVARPDGTTRVNSASTPYLATAGSGDVLAGICGTLLAAGLDDLDAASAGAYGHGFAGVLAADSPPGPVTAMDVAVAARAVPHALRA